MTMNMRSFFEFREEDGEKSMCGRIKGRTTRSYRRISWDHMEWERRHRTRLVHEATRELDVPTSLTPDPNHPLSFYFVGCAKEVSNLINCPVVILFGSRVSGTGWHMVTESVEVCRFSASMTIWLSTVLPHSVAKFQSRDGKDGHSIRSEVEKMCGGNRNEVNAKTIVVFSPSVVYFQQNKKRRRSRKRKVSH